MTQPTTLATPMHTSPEPEAASLGWWDRFSLTAAHGAVSALLAVLSLRGLYRFGRWFGTIEWLINYKRRRRFARALSQVLGQTPPARQRRRLTREHFMQSRCDRLIYLIFDRLPREQAAGLLTVGNRHLLDEALACGRGVYMAMSHHGAHHVIAMLMALNGYKVAGVRDRNESPMRRFVQDRFDRLHPEVQRMRVIYAGAYPRDIFRCLQDGYLLGSAMDVRRTRQPHQRTEEVTIFGERRAFLSGPLRVAVRCRAPVLQAFVLPEWGFRYRLEIVEWLFRPDDVTDEQATVQEAMLRYAANVERYVRATPSLLSRV